MPELLNRSPRLKTRAAACATSTRAAVGDYRTLASTRAAEHDYCTLAGNRAAAHDNCAPAFGSSRSTLLRILLAVALAFIALTVGPEAFAQSAPATTAASAIGAIPALTIQGGAANGQTYSLTLQVLLLMTALTLLPAILLMMTSFTRIVIVLGILRQALGAGQTPPNQVLVGLSLFLSLFIMSPVIDKVNTDAVKPYMAGQIEASVALERATVPLKKFMLDQTRESDIATFVRISGGKGFASPNDVPLSILVPAFVTSELKTAFLIGFLIFIPFVIIDLVVASVLMSMGMMMLSPVLISLPFKLMLFVLVDGWSLVMGTLAASFYR